VVHKPFWECSGTEELVDLKFPRFLPTAPRFVIKFVSTVYFPLDKDIVREMWVKGDLKDQLGIRHRSSKRRSKKTDMSVLESAPMIHEPHIRSGSDLDNEPHEDTSVSPPGLSPQVDEVAGSVENRTHLSPSSIPSRDERFSRSSSLRASYYSVSDLPPPSPTPSPVYRYSNGETTSIAPSGSGSIAARLSMASRNQRVTPPPSSPPPKTPTLLSTAMRQGSGGDTRILEDYEMRVRSPQGRRGTEYSTSQGSEDYWSADEGEDDDETLEGNGRSRVSIERSHTDFEREGGETERPPSSNSSWHGGVAL
jgi:phospholipid-translocating ATPase